MEDRHTLDHISAGGTTGLFGGVYDGHNGSAAAEYAEGRLCRYFTKALEIGEDIEAAMERAYMRVNEMLRVQHSGTTAVTFFISGDTIWHAGAGDARIIITTRGGEARQLTRDHRLDDKSEYERVTRAGAEIRYPYVAKESAGVMPTRALGDTFFEDVGVTAEPDTGSYEWHSEDRWLIAATDGLFDVMGNRDIAVFLRDYTDPERAGANLAREVLGRRGGTDNLTVILGRADT